jgi:HAE1 family hydrophobic/amphiphilic exporter-1
LTFLTSLALRRKPVTVMVMALLLAAGLFSYNSLRQELFPEISFSVIYVVTPYQQGNPNTVASEVTEKVEDTIIGMSGLENVTSISTSNLSVVTANFSPGEDIESAEDDIRTDVSALVLPDDAQDPIVVRLTSDIFPVMYLSVSGQRDIPSLQRIVDDQILPQLEAIDGIYQVEVEGGVTERVSVIVDPDRLEEYGLSVNDVINSVRANEIDLSGGELNRDGRNTVLRTYNGYNDLQSIGDVPVGYRLVPGSGISPGNGDATPILLSHVAEVTIDTPDAETISRTDGQPSLSLNVLKTPEGNTIELTNELLSVVDSMALPSDVRIDVLYNSGPELEEQLSNVMQQGGQGFVIAVAAIFLFLLQLRPTALRGAANTLRPTLIIAISIPLSILTTILVMAIFDWALNFMSLAGLAIAVGRIVDDSIVVLENTYRHVQAGEPRASAAVRGAREVGAAILASTLTTVAVFLPLAFIPGIVGEFFLPFAQTVCVSLLGSTFIALTAVPVLGSVLLRQGDMADEADSENTDTWLQRIYTPILTWTLRHRLITVFGCVGVVAASLPLLLVLPITLFSSGDPESMRIDITMPESTDVGAMFTEVSAVESILEGYREEGHITAYQVTMGSTSQDFGPSLGESGYDVAGFFIALSDDLPTDFIEELRGSLPEKEGVEFQLFVETAGPPQSGLEVAVTGPNFPDVQAVARDLVDWITPVEGVVNLKTNINDAQEELTFQVDLTEAGRYGLSSQDVASQVRTWTYGMDVSDVNLNGESYDLVVRGPGEMLDDIKDLQGLAIGGPLGTVPLGAISDVKSTVGPSIVTRYDGDRSVTITGEFEGQDTQAISAGINQIITQADLPPGVSVVQGGFASDIEEQFANVYLAMIIGVSLVYLVMVATLGSLRDPFIVVLSMPLAVVGALVALTLTGRALSLSSLMGFLFLIGIVVTNAIVLITFVNQLREEGRDVLDAMIVAGRTRLRPILMTAFTTIFALFPLAFSNTSGFVGAELATVVIGGLVSSTFLTLVAVPVTYMLMHESIPSLWARASGAVSGRRTPPASSPPASPLDSAAV